MVHIEGKNVPLTVNYVTAWRNAINKGDPGSVHKLLVHTLYRATVGQDRPNMRIAVAVAGLTMIDDLHQFRGEERGGLMSDTNLKNLKELFRQVAEGEDIEIDVTGKNYIEGVSFTSGHRLVDVEAQQRLAGARWKLRLGPDPISTGSFDKTYGAIAGLDASACIELIARAKVGEVPWRDVLVDWRETFNRALLRILVERTVPPKLRRASATAAQILLLALEDIPAQDNEAGLRPSPQVFDWWEEALGQIADNGRIAATLTRDNTCLLDVVIDQGRRLERYSAIGELGDGLAQTFMDVTEYAENDRTIERIPEEGRAGEVVIPAKRTKVGRNEPCPCNSGKKYKRCCGAAL